MKKKASKMLLWMIPLFVVVLGGVLLISRGERGVPGGAEVAEGKDLYICPMHPDYVSDEPGDCPICDMRLVLVSEEVDETEEEEDAHESGHAEHVPGDLATVKISESKQQLIGVKTAPVMRHALEKVIRTIGQIDHDEARIAYVNCKIGGWIEKLSADFEGKLVRKGDPLMEVYSPALLQAQEEYLQAIRNNNQALKERAKNKLLLWDIGERQIEEIEKKGMLNPFPIYSPITGFVVKKNVLVGQHFKPGENLFMIADHSWIWVYADIYEYELPFVQVGQEAQMELAYLPGETFLGKVTYIYPHLDEKTRTVPVRLEFPNPDYKLKHGMYANVKIVAPVEEHLAIDKDAVLDSGERRYVFVKKGKGTFEPRLVRLGPVAEGQYAILEGLSEGEEVVISANFLIDSESKLKAALSGMGGTGHQH